MKQTQAFGEWPNKPVDIQSPQHFPNPQLGQLKKENVSKLLLTVLTVIVKHIEHEELLVIRQKQVERRLPKKAKLINA